MKSMGVERNFSKDFVWGTASSSYQIEGAVDADGKGKSIWDVFVKEEGKIYEGRDASVACEFYIRYKDDIKLMKECGIKAYRFSLNWTRILPDGIGQVNEKGIDFYNAVIDELLANDIEPFITLFHWEYPYALHKKGGWLNDDSVDWFAEYAALVAERFSDRVTKFITINEPQCFIGLGYLKGCNAPGLQCMNADLFQMAHNALKAHGAAVKELREHAKQKIEIGFAPTGQISFPETLSQNDIEATRRHLFSCPEGMGNWTWNLAWWMDPVLLGHYPEDGLVKYKDYLPEITEEDMKLISQPIDFLGQNIYNGEMIRASKDAEWEVVTKYAGFPRTSMNWPVAYECLYWGPKLISERYKGIPIYITENGMACHDTVSLDEKVHDPNRIDFLARYLGRLKDAIAEGIDIRGYFQWAFTDNFEWGEGFNERFGLVYVDFPTQKRVLKDSAYWYRGIIETNGSDL